MTITDQQLDALITRARRMGDECSMYGNTKGEAEAKLFTAALVELQVRRENDQSKPGNAK